MIETRGTNRRRGCLNGHRFSSVEVLREDYDRLVTIESGLLVLRESLVDIDLSTRPGMLT